jgi:hypothetical protein
MQYGSRTTPVEGLRAYLAGMWSGRMPLPRAFWDGAIIYGTLLNAITTLAALAAIAVAIHDLIALAIYLLPLPYNVLAVVGVWRSAGSYTGPAHWAMSARIAVIVWAMLATLL